MIIVLFLKRVQLAEIKNKSPKINLLYKYVTQKLQTLVSKEKVLIKFQKLRSK